MTSIQIKTCGDLQVDQKRVFDAQDLEKQFLPMYSDVDKVVPTLYCRNNVLCDVKNCPYRHPQRVCRHWKRGNCDRGLSCTFAHSNAINKFSAPQCRFFQKGYCKFGDNCHYRHLTIAAFVPLARSSYNTNDYTTEYDKPKNDDERPEHDRDDDNGEDGENDSNSHVSDDHDAVSLHSQAMVAPCNSTASPQLTAPVPHNLAPVPLERSNAVTNVPHGTILSLADQQQILADHGSSSANPNDIASSFGHTVANSWQQYYQLLLHHSQLSPQQIHGNVSQPQMAVPHQFVTQHAHSQLPWIQLIPMHQQQVMPLSDPSVQLQPLPMATPLPTVAMPLSYFGSGSLYFS